jgi:ABC-type dipeptide/oligopeptide/nickel transport system permease component
VTRISSSGSKRRSVTAAKARGIAERNHGNMPSAISFRLLTSMTLSAASIVTGVFVGEIIYDINGI